MSHPNALPPGWAERYPLGECYDCLNGRCRARVKCDPDNACPARTAKDGAPLCRSCARGNDNGWKSARATAPAPAPIPRRVGLRG